MIHLPIGNIQKAVILLLFILWIQVSLFFLATYIVGEKLILRANHKYNCVNNKAYLIHCLLDYLLFSYATLLFIIMEFSGNTALPIFATVLISEIFRAKSFSKLIVSLEFDRTMGFKDYLSTLYLAINPIIGIWNIHPRIVNLLKHEYCSN
jgi:hypothetical protein